MKLAINYSLPAAALYSQGVIQIDYFKCPDWPDLISQAQTLCPVAVHFTLEAGSGRLHSTDWALVSRLLSETNTPYVNLHLDPLQKYYPAIPMDAPEPAQERLVIDRLLEDVWAAVERFGAERVILENVTYYGVDGSTMRPATLPEVIRRIIQETGAYLLLDIPHARIASHYLGMDEYEYIHQLPTECIREMHFTGLHYLEGRLQDHLSILKSDWPILDWAFERISSGDWPHPWLLAFEYGGVGQKFAWRSDPKVITEQVPILAEKIAKLNSRMK